MRKDRKAPKKISETDRAFYKLGFIEGEQQLKQTIILLKKTNRQLWEELCRLDEAEPRVGVLLSFRTINQIIKNAQKGIRNYYLAGKLEKMRDETMAEYDSSTAKALTSLLTPPEE